jgi:tight adherence protein C
MNGPSTRVEDFKLEDWLPSGLAPDTAIASLAALTVLAVFLTVLLALRSYNPFERRYAEIIQRKETLRRAAIDTRRQRPQMIAAGLMQTAVQSLNLMRSRHASEGKFLLAQAGMRSRDATIRYLFARITLPSLFAMVILMDSYGPHLLMIPPDLRFVAAFVAAAIGYVAPGIYIKNIAAKRAHRIQLGLPDALDLMVICAEAGLSLDAALGRVSRELEPSHPDVGEEFGITAAELTFLPDRRQAFENLNSRTNLPSIRGVVNTLLQTARFGTPLAASLRVLSAEYREARIVRAEEKAARLPAMLTVPMILFILPTLFIVLLGPATLGIIDTFTKKDGGSPRTTTIVTHSGGDDSLPGADKVEFIDKPNSTGATLIAQVTPRQQRIRAIDPVVVDIDARALAAGFQHRLALMPTKSPDVIDAAALAGVSVPVQASQMRVALPPQGTGSYEARLYYIPPHGSNYVVAARAPIDVGTGASGTTEASRLIHDAGRLGKASFDAKYRGQKLAIEGQFLRIEQHSADEVGAAAWLSGTVEPGKPYAAIVLGWTEYSPAINGGPAELVCLVPSDDPTLGTAKAIFRSGEPVVLDGTIAGFGTVFGKNSVIVSGCQLPP